MGPPRAKLFKRNVSPARRPRESDAQVQRGHGLHMQDMSERQAKKNQDLRALKGKAIATSPTAAQRKRKVVEVDSDSSSDEANDIVAAEESEDEGRQYRSVLCTTFC